MKSGISPLVKRIILFALIFLIIAPAAFVLSYPVEFTDSQGTRITITERPSRVVSLVPGITEMLFRIGAGDAVKAVTYHDTYPPEANGKKIIGGFISPSIEAIDAVNPDLIFISGLHKEVKERFGNGKCQLVRFDAKTMSHIYRTIDVLGRMFNRQKEASDVINEIRNELGIIAQKTARIPQADRKRVIRLMGRDRVMTPGDDSFQNEYIRLAGGIPPRLGKEGNVVSITKEEWVTFNPQIIYGCGGDRETEKRFFSQPGWKDVDAVRDGEIFYFPCDLTCRASVRAGDFVSSLSSTIYADEYSRKDAGVCKDRAFKIRHIDLGFDYVKKASVTYSRISDFVNKTLVIDFKEPLSVVSTLEGDRTGITSVGNHYYPPPCWGLMHSSGLEAMKSQVFNVIERSESTASILFTGADMDNLAVQSKRFQDMEVCALATAGVQSNSLRASVDEGGFYEPGTINIILLPNMRLTPRAMTRAIISATEAKVAALQDLDIRSSYSPLDHQATGTGTDNIIVVEGRGVRIDNAGGHTKMGELIAKAVYEAVQDAVYRQNGIVAGRTLFQRLKERKISLSGLMFIKSCTCDVHTGDTIKALEELLLQPRYAGFMESSLSVSDDYERGLINDLSTFELLCHTIAEEIAGREIEKMEERIADNMPPVLKMAFNALLNGLSCRTR